MKSSRLSLAPAVLALLALGSTLPARADTGDDPVLSAGIASCVYSEINARIDQFGNASYKVYGSCRGSAVSGQMAYRDGKFNESFVVNGARITTRIHPACRSTSPQPPVSAA